VPATHPGRVGLPASGNQVWSSGFRRRAANRPAEIDRA